MGRLFLIRHGQSEGNARGVLQGPRLDEGLTDLGRQQAEAVGHALRDVRLDGVYVSPMLRARETAEAIVRAHGGGLAPQQVPELYEIDYGDAIGQPLELVRDGVEQVYDAWRMGFVDQAFPGGESALVAQHRVRPFAARAVETAREQDLCVVAHGRINRILLATMMGRPLAEMESWPQPNASITELVIGEVVELVRAGDTRHLGLGSESFS